MSAQSPHQGGPAPANDLCVAKVPLFQGLSYEDQLEVARVARPVRRARGEQVYSQGEDVSQLMVVHTGRLKISRTSMDGHEQLIRVLGPGEFIGEAAFLTGAHPDHGATVLDNVELCVFRHADLGQFLSTHPSIAVRMLEGVSRRLGETESRLAAVITGNVSSRLADYLVGLPVQRGPGGRDQVVLPLAKKDIASLLDTTPESLSRQLRALSDAGVIEQGASRRITIMDRAALQELVTGG